MSKAVPGRLARTVSGNLVGLWTEKVLTKNNISGVVVVVVV
jgi:hypothetical protein